jgi:hypothetical protein
MAFIFTQEQVDRLTPIIEAASRRSGFSPTLLTMQSHLSDWRGGPRPTVPKS